MKKVIFLAGLFGLSCLMIQASNKTNQKLNLPKITEIFSELFQQETRFQTHSLEESTLTEEEELAFEEECLTTLFR
jgi:hypothetical protein